MSDDRAPTGAITAVIAARERGDVGFLVEHLADTNREVRWVAANSLRRLGSSEAVDPLLRVAEHAADDSFRILALKAVAEAGDVSAIPRLREIAGGGDPVDVRTTAVDALVRLGDVAAPGFLIGLLNVEGAGASRSRRWAADKLVELDAVEAVPALEAASRGGGPSTRLALRRAAARLRTRHAG